MKALDRKVWLPSGGSLVIDRTEAMTVVDVNTGKFVGSGGNLEQTVTRNNMEAAEEIVRQLRLRDIGGIIVIDFIDMVLESNRDLVLRRLTECLGRDRTKHQVAEVTSLGLVQMTRKRVGQGLLEVFSEPCEHCRGRGVIVSTDPVDEKRRSGGDGGPAAGTAAATAAAPAPRAAPAARGTSRTAGSKDAEPAPRRGDRGPAEPPPRTPSRPRAPARGGRRNRGRRGRGQSGEDRAAEDAAVLAGEPGRRRARHRGAGTRPTGARPGPTTVAVATPSRRSTTAPVERRPRPLPGRSRAAGDAASVDGSRRRRRRSPTRPRSTAARRRPPGRVVGGPPAGPAGPPV